MPYKEEETETVLPFRGGFRRGSRNARRALLRPLYCLLVGDNISVLLSALGTPLGTLGTVLPCRGVKGVLTLFIILLIYTADSYDLDSQDESWI